MSLVESHVSDVTTTTVEDSDTSDDDVSYYLSIRCDFKETDLVKRYYAAVKRIVRLIIGSFKTPDMIYNLTPVLLAEDVDPSVLEDLPSLVRGMHVKLTVRNKCPVMRMEQA